MTVLYSWAYRFGAFAERRKIALLFSLALIVPLAALTLYLLAPSFASSLFSPVCHQDPDRSIGELPLCSRCFGLYLGFGLSGFFAPIFSLPVSRRFLFVGILVSLVLVGVSLFSSVFDGNYVRFILGLSVGAGIAVLIKSVLK